MHHSSRFAAVLLLSAVTCAGAATAIVPTVLETRSSAAWNLSHTAARIRLLRDGGSFLGSDGVILQRSAYDCGPAALAESLGLRGELASPIEIARLAGLTTRGTTLGNLARVATALGHEATAVRITPAEFRHAPPPVPFIAWVDRRHFVTVVAIQHDVLRIHDPQLGATRVPMRAFLARWSGEALVFA